MDAISRIWQLFGVVFFMYLAAWKALGYQKLWGVSALGLVLFLIILKRPATCDMGFSWGNRRKSALRIAAFLLAATIIVALKAPQPCSLRDIVPNRLGYIAFAFFQEFLSESFLFTELKAIVGAPRAIAVTAATFSSLHLFNPVLTPATLVMGILLTWIFWKNKSLYEVAIIHAIIGVAGGLILPHRLLIVGIGYHYR